MNISQKPKENLSFRASGKLLLSGEYLVLAGARALALPLLFKQTLELEAICGFEIHWTSEDSSGVWFRAVFDTETLNDVSPRAGLKGHKETAGFLARLLRNARELNPGFLRPGYGYNVRVSADYPLEWGLGSSSSLISLIAQWSGADAFELFRSLFAGSAYDIACATSASPLFYQIIPGETGWMPIVSPANPGPALRHHAYFAYLGRKQDTLSELEKFSAEAKYSAAEIKRITELTARICQAERVEELCRYVDEHEAILGKILKRDVLSFSFPGFPGAVKSLGAWGGDFAMFVSRLSPDEVRERLKAFGIRQVFTYHEICIEKPRPGDEMRIMGNSQAHTPNGKTLSAAWESPSNIAFIKYWGKKGIQLPANPSLSMTLSKSVTRTIVKAVKGPEPFDIRTVNGATDHPFLPRMRELLVWLKNFFPLLGGYSFEVETGNSFPVSAGIASSASGMSAFALCLLDLAQMIAGRETEQDEFLRMASFVSRMGSGSASRSVYGGFALWGETPLLPHSSDEWAVKLHSGIHAGFRGLQDAILIVSALPKQVSSSEGHVLMDSHPFAGSRYTQAGINLKECLDAMHTGDFEKFAGVCENEALSLHSLLMTSANSNILILPASLQIMNRIRIERKKGLPLCFSLDAGPNVHLLYPMDYSDRVSDFIRDELLQFCSNGYYIPDQYGQGPFRIRGGVKQFGDE